MGIAWPPKLGELLPRAPEAVGIREKLADYSLNMAHEVGGPKARGFARILGITTADIDYLEAAIREGILVTPVSSVREGFSGAINCVVEIPVRGLGPMSKRTVNIKTVWELTDPEVEPRLASAYLKP